MSLLLIISELKMSLSKMEKIVNTNNNMILTARTAIRSTDVESYIKRNLSTFPKGANFIVLCGHHHRKDEDGNVYLDEADTSLVGDYASMFDQIIKECEKECKNKCQKCEKCQKFHSTTAGQCLNECVQCMRFHTWKEKEFLMGSVIPLYSIGVRDGTETKNEVLCHEEKCCACCVKNKCKKKKKTCYKKYTLLKSSRNSIQMKFNDLLKASQPHVLIFASCFSYESEINDILRSCGLLSALIVSAERGAITGGNVFKLDEEQQKFLQKISNDKSIKDVIIHGKLQYVF